MSTAIQTAKVQTLVAAAGNVLPAPSKDKDLVEEWVKKVEVEGAGDLKVSSNVLLGRNWRGLGVGYRWELAEWTLGERRRWWGVEVVGKVRREEGKGREGKGREGQKGTSTSTRRALAPRKLSKTRDGSKRDIHWGL